MTDEKVVDMVTRKPVEPSADAPDDSLHRFMKRWTKRLKDDKFKSVVILAIDGDNFCDWGRFTESELHSALMCITLDDVKEDFRAEIFQSGEDEEY